MKSLGQTLKDARELIPLTLRGVEDAVGISNAYLSQLENDKIKKPSANVLYKLAFLYNIPLDNLLYASGIIKEKPQKGATILSHLGKLTDEEERQLLMYLKFLRSQK